jgi:ribosome-binding protein aMBF1 (putative translation factor)
MAKKLKRISRKFTEEQKQHHAEIREKVMREFPPVKRQPKPSPPGIPARIRAARESRGLTWYAVAKKAGIPNSNTIRDIEQGKDVKLSRLKAVGEVLGLKLELVEV